MQEDTRGLRRLQRVARGYRPNGEEQPSLSSSFRGLGSIDLTEDYRLMDTSSKARAPSLQFTWQSDLQNVRRA